MDADEPPAGDVGKRKWRRGRGRKRGQMGSQVRHLSIQASQIQER